MTDALLGLTVTQALGRLEREGMGPIRLVLLNDRKSAGSDHYRVIRAQVSDGELVLVASGFMHLK